MHNGDDIMTLFICPSMPILMFFRQDGRTDDLLVSGRHPAETFAKTNRPAMFHESGIHIFMHGKDKGLRLCFTDQKYPSFRCEMEPGQADNRVQGLI